MKVSPEPLGILMSILSRVLICQRAVTSPHLVNILSTQRIIQINTQQTVRLRAFHFRPMPRIKILGLEWEAIQDFGHIEDKT